MNSRIPLKPLRKKPLINLLGAIVLVALLGCGQHTPSSRPMPTIMAYVPAKGASMLPNFPDGTLLFAEFGYAYDKLEVGDTVIAWDYTRAGNVFFHHRLKVKVGDSWIVQGDNPVTNELVDKPWVTRDNYIARTTGHAQVVVAPK